MDVWTRGMMPELLLKVGEQNLQAESEKNAITWIHLK